jgi:hypothetical protein
VNQQIHAYDGLDARGLRGTIELHQGKQIRLIGERYGRHAHARHRIHQPGNTLGLALDAYHAVQQ